MLPAHHQVSAVIVADVIVTDVIITEENGNLIGKR
jgi:hypothetical protein